MFPSQQQKKTSGFSLRSTHSLLHTHTHTSSSVHYTTREASKHTSDRTCRSSWRRPASSPAWPSRWLRSGSSRWRNSGVACLSLQGMIRFRSGSSRPSPSSHYKTHTPASPSGRESHLKHTERVHLCNQHNGGSLKSRGISNLTKTVRCNKWSFVFIRFHYFSLSTTKLNV